MHFIILGPASTGLWTAIAGCSSVTLVLDTNCSGDIIFHSQGRLHRAQGGDCIAPEQVALGQGTGPGVPVPRRVGSGGGSIKNLVYT